MALTLSTGMTKGLLDNASGKGLSEMLNLGAIYLYGSPRPSSSDDAETGTLLVKITDTSQTWTITDGTNGLTWDAASGNTVTKASAQTWSGAGISAGTAVWGRFYPYDAGGTVTGASTTLARFDFSVGTFSGDLIMPSVAITVGGTTTIDSFTITLPNGE